MTLYACSMVEGKACSTCVLRWVKQISCDYSLSLGRLMDSSNSLLFFFAMTWCRIGSEEQACADSCIWWRKGKWLIVKWYSWMIFLPLISDKAQYACFDIICMLYVVLQPKIFASKFVYIVQYWFICKEHQNAVVYDVHGQNFVIIKYWIPQVY